ncbi:IclR family transcriptional regulator [Amycolatopsis silviterrae]|uniref:IclR family transcriptional regulator n=1 Tax=Amycolatopsis silviterrae TaxID=1656914 RepID=A0ABW5HB07_9PSEU
MMSKAGNAAEAVPAGAQAVTRALGMLQCFRDNPGDLGVSELARRMNLSVSTAHRIARTLAATGFLALAEGSLRYQLGPAVAELGQLSLYQRGIHLAADELAEVAKATGTTADLAIRNGSDAVILAGTSVALTAGLGLRRPLHSTALGKVLLAWAPPGEDDLDALPPLTAYTARTITAVADLRAELDRVREAGYALNDGESAFGVRTIAVPVLRASGHVHAALALRSTSDTLTDDRLPWFLSRAQRCADALAVLLLEPGQRY